MANLSNKLIIGISSRALFDLDASHQVYEQEGVAAFAKHQIEKENECLEPGPAFPLVKKLLAIKSPKTGEPMAEVILVSRNSADTGLRVFNSIEKHNLNIARAAFTRGGCPYQYVFAFGADLFLSTNQEDVQRALKAGCAAATILPSKIGPNNHDQLRIAFDGDSVLFSDEAEKIYQQHGLDAFAASEKQNAQKPLADGPFKGFLSALHNIQSQFPADDPPIRTALVTARSAPAHERVIHTLRAWNIRVDESLFLGGLSKGEFLNAFHADFYFDDQSIHCDSAKAHCTTAHVPHGVINDGSVDDRN